MKTFCILLLEFLLLLSSGPETIDSANILALFNVPSPSHFIFSKVIARTLAARGHQVTVLTPDIDKDAPIPNLKYFHLDGVYDSIAEDFDYENFSEQSAFDMMFTVSNWIEYGCEKSFQSNGLQEFLRSSSTKTYDLIITEAAWGECFLGFIPKFGYPPVVAVSAYGIAPIIGMGMGTSFNPAYMPNMFLSYSNEKSIFHRLQNFITHNVYTYLYYNKGLPTYKAIAEKYLKQSLPPFEDLQRNFSIYLANTAFGFDAAIPLSPNIIPVGGMHIKSKPDPLPKDLKKFLDEAKDGFIFFSLGSNLRSDAIPKEKKQAILSAFSELSQRVLWKFESDNLEGLPPNVKIGKWLPQSDILAHPNIRMFISHCGKMSSIESTYWGVPVVGIPFFADQYFNLGVLRSKGVALKVDYKTLTKQSLLSSLQEILTNSSYQVNMKKLSETYRQYPVSSLERAVFWVEYIIKHGDASHLRPASTNLNWYQFLLLDVVLILIIGLVIIILVIYYTIKKVYSLIMGKSSDKKKTN